jgi:hypothetical protein
VVIFSGYSMREETKGKEKVNQRRRNILAAPAT